MSTHGVSKLHDESLLHTPAHATQPFKVGLENGGGGLLRARAWPCLGPEGPDVMPGFAAGPPGHARAQSMTA